MELFKITDIDFLGRRKYFLALSAVLIAAGLASMIAKGGLKMGIDFKGGTLVYVKFAEPPDVTRIRSALTEKGLSVAALQPFTEMGGTHELKIDLDLIPEEEDLTSGRIQIVETLDELYPREEGKLDFNNAGSEALALRLGDNSRVSGLGLTTDELREVAETLIAFRDQAPHSGLLRDFSVITSVPGVNPDITAVLPEETYLGGYAIRGLGAVGPKIGADLQLQARNATLAALGGMLLYVAFRFEWIYGVAAVAAVFHDVLVTLGFLSLFNREIELSVVAALLTLVGYSMNDSIVIFDRVRENRKSPKKQPLLQVLNLSVNQTLARTLLTSGLTLVAVVALFLFGGEALRGFSFALVVGVVVGTYSSIFIAGPILLWWQGPRNVRVASGGRARH
jgi:preprotein translocase subunit SecF